MSLHKQYYDLREQIWVALESAVHNGCDITGEFPVLTETIEHCTILIIIKGIIKDENYSIHPYKSCKEDLNTITNKITVIKSDGTRVKVAPDLLDLQGLSTYLSGGFSIYNN